MSANVVPHPPRWTVAPYFLVDDVVATANYYGDTLGFTFERFWASRPVSAWSRAGTSSSC